MGRRRKWADDQIKWKMNKREQRHPTLHHLPVSAQPGLYTEHLAALLSAGQTFRCIYADPPWYYTDDPPDVDARAHYAVMDVEAICALPVRDLAAEDAHLHLWATVPLLPEALTVLAAWGFAYKGHLVWEKTTKDGTRPHLGRGSYWRGSHELLLIGVRGHVTAQRKNLPSVLRSPRLSHSEKPEQARDLVEQFSPGPYLELFGRAVVPGWTVWGNQQLPRTGRLFKDKVG